MKNLKISLCLLSILLIIGCQTNYDLIDESPQIAPVESESDGFLGDYFDGDPEDDDPGIQMITITVQYASSHDKAQIRQLYGGALNLQSFFPCPFDPNKEMWVIPIISESQLFSITAAVTLNTSFFEVAPTSVHPGPEGNDPIMGIDPDLEIIKTEGLGEKTQFFFSDLCD